MLRKKACKCGSIFKTETNETKCQSCVRFRDYRCSRPQFDKIIPHDEIHFAFKSSWVNTWLETHDNVKILGNHARNPNRNDYSVVWVNLFNFEPRSPTVYKEIAQTIAHEYVHKSLFDLGEFEASIKWDFIARKIESWINN
jgi:hypothetical protein